MLRKAILEKFVKRDADSLELTLISKDIPEDCVIPTSCAYGDPLETLVDSYIHNYNYGYKEGLLQKKDHKHAPYWFPYFFSYDWPMQVYMINLKPNATERYGIWSKYRATDYTAESGYTFRILDDDVGEKLVIPDISQFRENSTDSSSYELSDE